MDNLKTFIELYGSGMGTQVCLFLLVLLFVVLGCGCTRIETDGSLKPYSRFVAHSLSVFFIFHYFLLRTPKLHNMILGQVLCLAGIVGVFGHTVIARAKKFFEKQMK